MTSLFGNERSCELCGFATKIAVPGRTSIVALNVTIYRRGAPGRRELVTTKRVRVCDQCLGKALAAHGAPNCREASRLAASLFERITGRYSAMGGVLA